MPKPAVPGCPSTGGEFFLSVVSYVAKRKKGLASWRSPFCFSGTNAPVDVVTLFQPTPPARGTTGGDHLPIPQYHISIHAPARGATLRVHDSESQGENFNPPPPARGATTAGIGTNLYLAFQSTSHTRGATGRGHSDADGQSISIHSPARRATSRNIMSTIVLQFQSTSPVRGTTSGHKFLGGLLDISIHAPARGRQQKQPKFQAVFTTIR